MQHLNNITLLHENPMLVKASYCQKKYIKDSTYDILTPEGRNFKRTFELLAYSMMSGKVLVKEKVSFSGDEYEKVYVLSNEGETEKFREEDF